MLRNLTIWLLAIYALSGCLSQTAESKTQQLHDSIMHIHDEAMAKMGYMMQLKHRLEAKQDTSVVITQAIEQLKDADTYMMRWMRAYHKPETGAQAIPYLQEQIFQVLQVSQKIDSAIYVGEYLLK